MLSQRSGANGQTGAPDIVAERGESVTPLLIGVVIWIQSVFPNRCSQEDCVEGVKRVVVNVVGIADRSLFARSEFD